MATEKADLGELQRSAFHHLNKSETIEREQQPLSPKETFNAPLMKRQDKMMFSKGAYTVHRRLGFADGTEELHLLFYGVLDRLCAGSEEFSGIEALAL